MPRIFGNISEELLATLRMTLQVSERADFCVGCLNLRGWQAIDDLIQPWVPENGQLCRVLIGMQRPPHDEIKDLCRTAADEGVRRTIPYKQTGLVEYDEFYPRLVKDSIDGIDRILQDEFSLSEDQIDYLLGFDIKYRMGQVDEDSDD